MGLSVHVVFNLLAYSGGSQLYLHQAKEKLPSSVRFTIMWGALLGALAGSVLLSSLSDPLKWLNEDINFWHTLWQRQTVVGGLLGGLIGVELAKKWLRYTPSTGDSFVPSLILGMMIGRVGCFLTGLSDNTHGDPTSLPWGVNFGDGISRHPAQLYDIFFLFLLFLFIHFCRRSYWQKGDAFKVFMTFYLTYRFWIDFLKPYPRPFLGLHIIQVACLAGIVYYMSDIRRIFFGFAKGES